MNSSVLNLYSDPDKLYTLAFHTSNSISVLGSSNGNSNTVECCCVFFGLQTAMRNLIGKIAEFTIKIKYIQYVM